MCCSPKHTPMTDSNAKREECLYECIVLTCVHACSHTQHMYLSLTADPAQLTSWETGSWPSTRGHCWMPAMKGKHCHLYVYHLLCVNTLQQPHLTTVLHNTEENESLTMGLTGNFVEMFLVWKLNSKLHSHTRAVLRNWLKCLEDSQWTYGSNYTNLTLPPACTHTLHHHYTDTRYICCLLSRKQYPPFSSALFISFPTWFILGFPRQPIMMSQTCNKAGLVAFLSRQ